MNSSMQNSINYRYIYFIIINYMLGWSILLLVDYIIKEWVENTTILEWIINLFLILLVLIIIKMIWDLNYRGMYNLVLRVINFMWNRQMVIILLGFVEITLNNYAMITTVILGLLIQKLINYNEVVREKGHKR